MKQILSSLIALILLAPTTFAQTKSTPVYLLFNSSCMNVLDYKYAFSSNSLRTYSIRTDMESPELYLFQTEGEPLEKSTIPANTDDCGSIDLNRTFIDAINTGKKVVYIVQPNQDGCSLYRVGSATMITNSRDTYSYRGPDYAFTFDTSDMVYNKNLAPVGAGFTIYLEGLKIYECRDEYQFRVEAKKAGGPEGEFYLIPDMGITYYKYGADEAAADDSQYQLSAFNNFSKKDYIDALCDGKNPRPKTYATSSKAAGKSTKKVAPREDAEVKSLQNEDGIEFVATPANKGIPKLAECPYEPGPGYHIVQPGDNLIGISRAYNVPVGKLLRYNDLKNPDRLEVCQIIYYVENAEAPQKVVKPETYDVKKKKVEETKVQNQKTYWTQTTDDDTESAKPVTHSTKTKKDGRNLDIAKYNKRDAWVHVVQKGESLYSISRLYDMDEDYLRDVNGYAADEKVILHTGDKIVLSYCTYDKNDDLRPFEYGERIDPSENDRSYAPEQRSNTPSKKSKTKGSIEIVEDDDYYDQKPVSHSTKSRSTVTKSKTGTDTFSDLSDDDRSDKVSGQQKKSGSKDKPVVKPLTKPSSYDTADEDVYYQDHIVHEGDTYEMIARMYNVKLQDLLKANKAEDKNESLIPTQTVVVPRRFSEYASNTAQKKDKTTSGSKKTTRQ